MRLKNIVSKLLFYIRQYWLLIFLLVLLLCRFYFYSFPKSSDPHFENTFIITNPVLIDDGTFILKSGGMSYYSHIPFEYRLGTKVYVKGSKKYSAVYINNVKKVPSNYLEILLFNTKSYLIGRIKQTVLEPFASLILGMLYGVEPNFDKPFNDVLIKSGVIHTIVVSGYNITILFSVIAILVRHFSMKKRFIICSLVGLIYSYFVGFEPPVFRALVFGVFLLYAKSSGFKSNLVYLLIITSILMCIISPSVLFSVSFQLSVLSTLGILLLVPIFEPLIKHNRNYLPAIISESFVTSFSAQILVMPIIMYYFKSVSVFSLIVNSLILWVIPLIMFLGFSYSVVLLLNLPLITEFGQFLVYLPLTLFVNFVTFVSNLPYSYLSVSLTPMLVFVSYILIFTIICAVYYKKSHENNS